MIERYTRKDAATMINEITIDDPVMYSHPWTVSFAARARPDEELMEYICQDGRRTRPSSNARPFVTSRSDQDRGVNELIA